MSTRSRSLRSRSVRKSRGFTLMEVLLVLAILVILGSLVTVSYINIQKSSNIKAAGTQLSLLEEAIGLYQLDMGTAPPSVEALNEPPTDSSGKGKYQGPYLKQAMPADPWSNPYKYERTDSTHYRVWSAGPDGTDGTADDITKVSSN